ncbi:MAG: hypothetical protein ACRDXX_02300 [Stackebrandtia sp.]
MTGDSTFARTQALRDLIALDRPLDDAVAALQEFTWKSDEVLAVLTRSDAARVLSSYLNGAFSAEEVQKWAETLEDRHDLGLEPAAEGLLKTCLFELSTLPLFQQLTREVALEWMRRLAVR